MKQITIDKYKHASAFLKERCIRLWEHENSQNGISRNTAQIVFPIKFAYVEGLISNGGPAINTVRQMLGNEAAETLFRRFLFGTEE